MKLTIERVANGYIIDAPKRKLPDANLPWLVVASETGDEHTEMIDLLYAIRELFDPNVRIEIKRADIE